jgi:hypothetical protein
VGLPSLSDPREGAAGGAYGRRSPGATRSIRTQRGGGGVNNNSSNGNVSLVPPFSTSLASLASLGFEGGERLIRFGFYFCFLFALGGEIGRECHARGRERRGFVWGLI